jgi:hypothetical protein
MTVRALLEWERSRAPRPSGRARYFATLLSDSVVLIDRIHLYFMEINADPVIFRWKYKMDDPSIG